MSELRRTTGLAYGFYGNYMDNLQVIFKRREKELKYKDFNFITCGTVIDSNAYSFLITDVVTRDRNLLPSQYAVIDATMRTQGLVYSETWDYDYAFYLPLSSKAKATPKERLLDEAIGVTIEAYLAPVSVVDPEDFNEQITKASALIREVEKQTEIEEADEQRVRGSGETSEAIRRPARSMSDVLIETGIDPGGDLGSD